jgi:DNA-binding MarR family transcriptional regulator
MVPASTAQRVISKLVDARLLKRTKDPQDTRRSFITLEPHARSLLEHILV